MHLAAFCTACQRDEDMQRRTHKTQQGHIRSSSRTFYTVIGHSNTLAHQILRIEILLRTVSLFQGSSAAVANDAVYLFYVFFDRRPLKKGS